ncbi:translation elongation factor 2 [Trichonephila inaurata madagascariensis]|uniref:Translation elongation factor 2 n=1 Tax=Trichonephila inaurata madagascariensis TaxID=2747483 RepID=A0A8X6YHS8_9ARAC|nr:translation elongation factor 2 [Trichonephila inaurata madagascariensis]
MKDGLRRFATYNYSNIKDALIDSGSQVTLIRKSRCNVEICVVDDDAMLFDVIIGLNVLMQSETIIYENGVTIKNKPKCAEEAATLSSKDKTITPDFAPVKKDGLHVKDDQRIVTASPVVRVPVELQHPSNLPKLEDGLKRIEKTGPMIYCITDEPGDHIVAGTEEHFEICVLERLERRQCLHSFKQTDPVVVFPGSMPKEVKRRYHEKRHPVIKENIDYYLIPKLKQKMKHSIANCDHHRLVNYKRRKKEDVPLKTYYSDHLGPHRITNFEVGVMEQTIRFVQDLLYLTTKDVKDTKT